MITLRARGGLGAKTFNLYLDATPVWVSLMCLPWGGCDGVAGREFQDVVTCEKFNICLIEAHCELI